MDEKEKRDFFPARAIFATSSRFRPLGLFGQTSPSPASFLSALCAPPPPPPSREKKKKEPQKYDSKNDDGDDDGDDDDVVGDAPVCDDASLA